MAVKQVQYESLLSTCSEYSGALALLRQYRPYLEAIPSMRRPQESIVTIPLPNIRVRQPVQLGKNGIATISAGEAVALPCDVVLLMCDPEWKIKTGVELFIFIHRPQEDFSDLLMRWRQTQIFLDRGYEWMLPARHEHLLNDGADVVRPLFVVFPDSPSRILKGLQGAGLPAVTYEAVDEGAIADLPLPNDSEVLREEDADDLDFADLDDIGTSEG
ncbi:MAG: hypothetical protein O3C67_07770 [Cyanobacteria bacterium]|nr:hypothetical protein [Cyanobacteriota bacterium]MEB3269752.1 hypothetical protein [Leptolyngbya sp.]